MSALNVRQFVHLHVHTTYSLGAGLSSPREICRHARRVGYDAVAITDVNGTFGFVEFHRAAREVGVKPIYGTFIELDGAHPGKENAFRHSLVLLAVNREGLRNVCLAASTAAMRRERDDAIHLSNLLALSDGVVALVGAAGAGDDLYHDAQAVMQSLRDAFGQRLFVERVVGADQSSAMRELLAVATELGVPSVLTADVRFAGVEKHELIDLVAADDDGSFEHRVYSRSAMGGAPGGLTSASEMSSHFDTDPDAFTNASLIASMVDGDLLEGLASPPREPPDDLFQLGSSEREQFFHRVMAAFDRSYPNDHPERAERWAILNGELETIEAEGLISTFLQFHEITQRLDRSGVRLGPATGLRLQSFTAFLLGITAFDPYDVDEHFVAAFGDRNTGVLDLQIGTRDRPAAMACLAHVFDAAGIGYVPSVEHITPARAMRIVGKRMNLEEDTVERVVKIANDHSGVSLKTLCEENRSLGAMYRRSRPIRDAIAHAAAIEGLPFGFVRSKRSLVVSRRPLRDFLGHIVSPGSGEMFVQSTRNSFPFGDAMRIDVTALHAIDTCTALWRNIETPKRRATRRKDELAVESRWPDRRTADVYAGLEDDDMAGVYLLESPLTQRLAIEFGVHGFDELVLFLALMRYRRADMSFADRVERIRKHAGRAGDDPMVAPTVEHTNGWLIFADQLRDVIQLVTGMITERAVKLLTRMRSLEPADLAQVRAEFMGGAAAHGTDLETATRWFTRISRATHRSVARQRAIADALLTLETLYLKQTQPLEFAVMRLNQLPSGARRNRLVSRLRGQHLLLSPDINESERLFRVVRGKVRPPLWIVDGISEAAAERVIRARERKNSGKFDNPQEIRLLVSDKSITYKEVEALVRVRAFDSVGFGADEVGLSQSKPDEPKTSKPRRDGSRQLTLPLDGQPAEESPPASNSQDPS